MLRSINCIFTCSQSVILVLNVMIVFYRYTTLIIVFPRWNSYHENEDKVNAFSSDLYSTVVPLIRGHLGARAKVSLHRRCPLIRGTAFFFKI